jgi:hypothetical protein
MKTNKKQDKAARKAREKRFSHESLGKVTGQFAFYIFLLMLRLLTLRT